MPLKFLSDPLEMISNSLFYWVAASVDISCFLIDTNRSPVASVRSPTVAGITLNVLGWRVVQLFYQVNTGGFHRVPVERGKYCNS